MTPAGVAALLGMPMRELAGRTVPLAAVVGSDDELLASMLASSGSWRERFAVLDRWLRSRLASGMVPRPDISDISVMAGWRILQRERAGEAAAGRAGTGSGGAGRVGATAAALGISRRRLESLFQREVGITPGMVARTARFQRAVRMLAAGTALPRVAADSGYADQPHLTREVHALSGLTPAMLRAGLARSFKTPERVGS
ncbi:hypothetical protein ACTI_08020 [Actinoplanes sp. OR16]|uniref:AraC family transcriptional regulator n=1 Tax=Actinoplanes sp. OR16 TaxID=946334 RepID=UPI000F6E481F|nr:helix-turn-helix domain-containing protein [Actinoplanes sp. OR16]BBH64117.1 hypothetical protein ACTI_08020 [Actinoplanes sp. OR16]